MVIQAAGHDVTATDQTDALTRIQTHLGLDHVTDPRTTGIDQHPRIMRGALIGFGIARFDAPQIAVTRRAQDLGARHDMRAAGLGIAGV